MKYQFTYYGDALANPAGGEKQGFGYDGRIGFIFDANLEKLAGWSGATFHASIHDIQGTSFSAANVGNLMLVSSVEAHPTLRLFNLWVEQTLSPQVNLRIGQITAAQEFFVSDTANLFVNSTFGWPTMTQSDLPSGGPAYPEATPGVRVTYIPNETLTVRAAIFDGDPAGVGLSDPIIRDPNGVVFRLSDPPLLIGELAFDYNEQNVALSGDNSQQEGTGNLTAGRQLGTSTQTSLPGAIKFGAWLHTGRFADERAIAQTDILGAPGAQQPEHATDAAIYGLIDQTLWRDGARSIGSFVRMSVAPSDRNLIDRYIDAGVTLKGLMDSRPNDVGGVAVALARISPDAVTADRDAFALRGLPTTITNFEATIELTYRMSLADQLYLQPNIQYVVHPSGSLADLGQQKSYAPTPNALVVGLRTVFKF